MPYYNTDREQENHIQEIRIDRGMTIKELSEKAEVLQPALSQLMSGMVSPIYQMRRGEYRQGEIKPWVDRICLTLKVKPEVMFPREVCPLEDPTLKGIHQTQINEISLGNYCQQDIYNILTTRRLKKFLWRFIVKKFWFRKDQNWKQYPRKYKNLVQVIQLRFLCDMTLDAISEKLNISKETIRQREAKALRLMRHPNFTREFKKYY